MKAESKRFKQIRRYQAVFKFAGVNYILEQFLMKKYFQAIKYTAPKEENPWAKKAIHYLAKNQTLNLQVSLWRLRDYKNPDFYRQNSEENLQNISASPLRHQRNQAQQNSIILLKDAEGNITTTEDK